MAKIKRVVQPSVGAPDLTGASQRINIPKGAFGQDVSQAVSNLGRNIEFSAEKLGDAHFRMQERQSVSDAANAFKDVPVNELTALEEAKKNPGDLNTFTDRFLADYDKRTEDIAKTLENPRTRQRFMSKALATRTTLGKNSVTWKSREFILQGRNNLNAELGNNARAAGADIPNINDYYSAAAFAVKQGAAAGFLLDGRGKKEDPSIRTLEEMRRIDYEIANNLMLDNPVKLLELLDSTVFKGLNAKDKKTLTQEANNSFNNIVERADTTRKVEYFSKNIEQYTKFQDGTLGWKELDEEQRIISGAVANGDADAIREDETLELIKELLNQPEDVEFAEAVKEKKFNIETLAEAKIQAGAEKTPKPTKAEQSKAYVGFTNRFLDFDVQKVGRKGKKEFKIKNASVRLSDLLDFQVDLLKAQNDKLITLAEGKAWMNKLLPTLRKKIESKHFEERKGMFRFDREADIYSDAFSHVLDTLETNPDLNTSENQAEALRLAFEIAEGLDIDKEKDPVKRSELLRSVGKRAIDELNRSLHPSLNHLDELPDAIVEAVPDERTFQIMEDAQGNKARVFSDGTFEEIE